MTIDWNDPAIWAVLVALLAFVASVVALFISARSLKWQKKSALAADRSANAAEKASAIHVVIENRPMTAPPDEVRWSLERSKDRFTLRNTGTAVATGVVIAGRNLDKVGTGVPQDAAVRPNASVSFMMAGSLAHSVPDEIEVSWDGHPEPVVLPVPPR